MRRVVAIAVGFLCAGLLAVLPLRAGAQPVQPKKGARPPCGLKVELTAKKKSFRFGEPFLVHGSISNVSGRDVVIGYPPSERYYFVSEKGSRVTDPIMARELGTLAEYFYRMPAGQTISWTDDLSSRLFNHKEITSGRYRGRFVWITETYACCREFMLQRSPECWKLEKSLLPERLLCKELVASEYITVDFIGWHDLQKKQREDRLRPTQRTTDTATGSCHACSVRDSPDATPSLPAMVLVAAVGLLGRRGIRRRAFRARRAPTPGHMPVSRRGTLWR